jgi:hypothetical protein
MTVLESLREYFKNTPREQVEKDWAKYDYLDDIGPNIGEFFNQCELSYDWQASLMKWELISQYTTQNPGFTSDFFFFKPLLKI